MQSLPEITSMTTSRAAFANADHKSNIYVCGRIDQNNESIIYGIFRNNKSRMDRNSCPE